MKDIDKNENSWSTLRVKNGVKKIIETVAKRNNDSVSNTVYKLINLGEDKNFFPDLDIYKIQDIEMLKKFQKEIILTYAFYKNMNIYSNFELYTYMTIKAFIALDLYVFKYIDRLEFKSLRQNEIAIYYLREMIFEEDIEKYFELKEKIIKKTNFSINEGTFFNFYKEVLSSNDVNTFLKDDIEHRFYKLKKDTEYFITEYVNITNKESIFSYYYNNLSQTHLLENILQNIENGKTFKIDSTVLKHTAYTLYDYTNILKEYVNKDIFLTIPKFLISVYNNVLKEQFSNIKDNVPFEDIAKINNEFEGIEYYLKEIEQKYKNTYFCSASVFYTLMKYSHELLTKLNHSKINFDSIIETKCNKQLEELSNCLMPLYTYKISKNLNSWYQYKPKDMLIYRGDKYMVLNKDNKEIIVFIYNKNLTRRDSITLNYMDFYRLVFIISSIDLNSDFIEYSFNEYYFDDLKFYTNPGIPRCYDSPLREKALILEIKNLQLVFKEDEMQIFHKMFVDISKSQHFKNAINDKIKHYGAI